MKIKNKGLMTHAADAMTGFVEQGIFWLGFDNDGRVYGFTAKPYFEKGKWQCILRDDKNVVINNESDLKLVIKAMLSVKSGKNGLVNIAEYVNDKVCLFNKLDIKTKHQSTIEQIFKYMNDGYSKIKHISDCSYYINNSCTDGKFIKDVNMKLADGVAIDLNNFNKENKLLTSIVAQNITQPTKDNKQNYDKNINKSVLLEVVEERDRELDSMSKN